MIQVYRNKITLAILLLSVSICASRLQAQQPNSAMRVRIGQNGVNKFMADLQHIIKLNNGANTEKQWKNLEEDLDVFLEGMIRNFPIRCDLILGDGLTRFRPSIPVRPKFFRHFRTKNLKPRGIDTFRRNKKFYVCKGAFMGFMYHQGNYATFVEQPWDLDNINLKNIPASIKPLVAKYDLGMVGENTELSVDAINQRRDWINKLTQQILAGFQKKDEETEDNFEFRKSMFGLQLHEIERFYSEASTVQMGWNTDIAKNEGRGELFLKAIPDSSLDKAIALLGQKHSHFANIPRNENSILSFRLNHPLDDVRKRHLQTVLQTVSDKATSKIDTESKRSTEERETGKKVLAKLQHLLAENVEAGIADAFVEVWTNPSKKQTALAGFRVSDGKEFDELLKLLPKTRKGRIVKAGIEKIDGFEVHQITTDKDDNPSFLSLFDVTEIHIATSKNVIWVAAGEKAINALKKSIEAAKAKTDNKSLSKDVIFNLFVKIKPWLDIRAKQSGKNGNFDLRAKALAAFAGADDTLNMELRKKGKLMIGNMRVGQATLRFVGLLIIDAAKKI